VLFFAVNQELHKTGKFELMSLKTDEDEHSIEMQLSYIAKVMERYLTIFQIGVFVANL
jgi:predicted class III extradiol MEMO1 family dioxygenase